MCIIIDTNTLTHVFQRNSANHEEFKPVLNWIFLGKGIIIFGGTKYKGELKKYLRLFGEFKKVNKAISISDADVDNEANNVASMIQDPNFDDQHLVALLRKSGCRLICSLDDKAYIFFRHSSFFKSTKKPKIYSSAGNANLLCDINIAKICKPCRGATRAQQKNIETLLNAIQRQR